MSARNNLNWGLLDQHGDPVPGDPGRVTAAQQRYAKVATVIHETAGRLQKVTSADGLKGKYADAVQNRAKDVANDLTKAVGRYDAVAQAIGVYQPVLQHAREESEAAVHDAENASAAQTKAQAMPDPAANRPADAPPLTQVDQDAVTARKNAGTSADSALAAAKTRLQSAVAALNDAGQALERAVSKNAFKGDGLTDSTLDKFNAFLKMLVKVLQWIGIALAAIALVIPGLGTIIAVVGAVIAVTVLVVDITLAAQGEASWIDVAFAAVGVVLLGAGSLLAKGLQNIGTQIRNVLGPAFRNFARPGIERNFATEMRNFMNGTSNQTAAEIMAGRNAALEAAENTGRTAGGRLPENPEWWQFNRPGYLAGVKQSVRDGNIVSMLRDGKFLSDWPKAFAGVDGVSALRYAGGVAGRNLPAVGVGAPSAWFYAGAAGLKGIGYGMFGFGLASGPISFIPGDHHHIQGFDDAKDHATSGH